MPVSSPAAAITPGSSRGARLPYQKSASTTTTMAATAPDSVGVKTPPRMPPRMITGIASTGSASSAVLPTVRMPAKGRFLKKPIRRTTR